jgi:hypothetical protein
MGNWERTLISLAKAGLWPSKTRTKINEKTKDALCFMTSPPLREKPAGRAIPVAKDGLIPWASFFHLLWAIFIIYGESTIGERIVGI